MAPAKASNENQIEEVTSGRSSPVVRPSKRLKVQRHCRRFWWLHLLIFIAGTLVIVLCLLYVAFPRISQKYLDESTLSLNSLELSNPTGTTFHMKQNATIGNDSPYHPNLDSFNASMSLAGGHAPFLYATLPPVHATKTAITLLDTDITIADLDAFSEYNKAVILQEEVQVVVQGRTDLHEMKFPTAHVTYNETATIKGFNSLAGFAITNFTVKLKPEADGSNMLGTVYIPNPTVLTLAMGNLTFDNYLPAINGTPRTFIGKSMLQDVTLRPGNNTIPMRSTVNQSLVISSLVKYHQDGLLPISITGNSSIFNGQHLTFYERGLQALTNDVVLDVGTALQGIGLNLTALIGLGDKVGDIVNSLATSSSPIEPEASSSPSSISAPSGIASTPSDIPTSPSNIASAIGIPTLLPTTLASSNSDTKPSTSIGLDGIDTSSITSLPPKADTRASSKRRIFKRKTISRIEARRQQLDKSTAFLQDLVN